jgi:hypothetical protein
MFEPFSNLACNMSLLPLSDSVVKRRTRDLCRETFNSTEEQDICVSLFIETRWLIRLL